MDCLCSSCLKIIWWMFMKGYPSPPKGLQWRKRSDHDQSVLFEAREDLLRDLILSLPLGKFWEIFNVTAITRDVTHSLDIIPNCIASQKHVFNRSSVHNNSFRGNHFQCPYTITFYTIRTQAVRHGTRFVQDLCKICTRL